MKYNRLTIEELHQKLINKEITVEDLIKESKELEKTLQEKCNAFDFIIDNVVVLLLTYLLNMASLITRRT